MPDDYVTETTCQDRHKRTWRILSLILTIIGVFVVGVGWSVGVGYEAINQASEAQTAVEVHAAAAAERNEAISESLNRIEATQIRMDQRLDKVLHGGE